MKTTRRLIFAAIPAFALAAIDVFADSYPDRRITIVIPFPAGGPTDAIARPLAQALSASLGQPVIVETASNCIVLMSRRAAGCYSFCKIPQVSIAKPNNAITPPAATVDQNRTGCRFRSMRPCR